MENGIIIEPQSPTQGRKPSNAGQGLGIIGLVFGALATMLAFIPCVGVLALIPGGIALLASVIGLLIAYHSMHRGLLIAALIISLIGTGVAATQVLFLSGVAKSAQSFSDPSQFGTAMSEDASLTAEELLKKYQYETDVYGNLSEASFTSMYAEMEMFYTEAEQVVDKLEEGKVMAAGKLPGMMTKGANLMVRFDTLEPYLTIEQKEQFRRMEAQFDRLMTRLTAFGY